MGGKDFGLRTALGLGGCFAFARWLACCEECEFVERELTVKQIVRSRLRTLKRDGGGYAQWDGLFIKRMEGEG